MPSLESLPERFRRNEQSFPGFGCGRKSKQPRVIGLQLAILLLTLVQSRSESQSQLPTTKFYVLVQDWFAERCSTTGMRAKSCVNLPREDMKQYFVPQGLWVREAANLAYTDCEGDPLDTTILDWHTERKLSDFWPNITFESSWSQAWSRYGTCSNLSQNDYFAKALGMNGLIVSSDSFSDFVRSAIAKKVSASQVAAAFGIKDSAVLLCDDGSKLATVYTCWSIGSSDLPNRQIECPSAFRKIQNCEASVYLPRFQDKQSEIATAFWQLQYTVLFMVFFQSWRADRDRRKRSRFLTTRTAIQFCGMIHAGTGVFSELFAISVDAGGETGLALWPWLSMLELVSNLSISVLMIHQYAILCKDFRVNSEREDCAFVHHKLLAFCWTLVVLAWTFCYLWFNLQHVDTDNIMRVELNPIRWSSRAYYIINGVLEVHCLCLFFRMKSAIDGSNKGIESSINLVLGMNLVSFLDSFVLFAIHVPPIQESISNDWHPSILGILFFIRYVTVSVMINPLNGPHTDDSAGAISEALHLGSFPPYKFQRGAALVICNFEYEPSCSLDRLDNELDASRFETALRCIGFDVARENNVCSTKLEMLIKDLSERSRDDGSINGIAFAFSGHGDTDCIIGVDGEKIPIREIKAWVKTKLLGGKVMPKLFFFECCRGDSQEIRRPRVAEQRFLVPARQEQSFRVPLWCAGRGASAETDFLECHATSNLFTAYDQADGSGPFAKALCNNIDHMTTEGGHDIEDALKRAIAEVSRQVIGRRKRQCPHYESSLTRRFVLRRPESRRGAPKSEDGSMRGDAHEVPLLPRWP